jgi:hypothetical protein
MDSRTAPTVDVSAFRKAMGSFPTGVTVVTVAHGDGDMHGVTVNSSVRAWHTAGHSQRAIACELTIDRRKVKQI